MKPGMQGAGGASIEGPMTRRRKPAGACCAGAKFLDPTCGNCKPEDTLAYCAEATRAERRIARGHRQVYCPTCRRWRWTWEVHDQAGLETSDDFTGGP